jgi:hypothetical protein
MLKLGDGTSGLRSSMTNLFVNAGLHVYLSTRFGHVENGDELAIRDIAFSAITPETNRLV